MSGNNFLGGSIFCRRNQPKYSMLPSAGIKAGIPKWVSNLEGRLLVWVQNKRPTKPTRGGVMTTAFLT